MKVKITSFLSGLIFSVGLAFSEMAKPERVIGFLDIFGDWDPTLLFVIGGAVSLHMITYPLITKRSKPVFVKNWSIPQKSKLTFPLFAGAFLFGVGWGLGGYCPGPGITASMSFDLRPILFVSGMLVGMLGHKTFHSK